MGGPAPVRPNSPACSPRPASTPTAGRSAIRTRPATWPPSIPSTGSPTSSPPPHAAAAPNTSANSSSSPDGAHWIWNLANQRFPAATQIVDLFHAREHLHELTEKLAFILPDPAAWYEERRADLDNGDVEAIITAARIYPLVGIKATERDKALAYFETNAHRMRYARFRRLGMFVGSGTVEAGCKAVIGQRLKLSGMRWSAPGATGIITLRCQKASTTTPEHNQITAA